MPKAGKSAFGLPDTCTSHIASLILSHSSFITHPSSFVSLPNLTHLSLISGQASFMFAHHFSSTLEYHAETVIVYTVRQPLHSPWAPVSEPNDGPVPARTRGSNAAKELRLERFEGCERP
jgi:hypothetical protein